MAELRLEEWVRLEILVSCGNYIILVIYTFLTPTESNASDMNSEFSPCPPTFSGPLNPGVLCLQSVRVPS